MNKKQDFQDIKQQIKQIVSTITEIPLKDLKDDADFTRDLGIDSMMALEIVASIEKKYRITIPEEKIPEVTSLGKIYRFLEENLGR